MTSILLIISTRGDLPSNRGDQDEPSVSQRKMYPLAFNCLSVSQSVNDEKSVHDEEEELSVDSPSRLPLSPCAFFPPRRHFSVSLVFSLSSNSYSKGENISSSFSLYPRSSLGRCFPMPLEISQRCQVKKRHAIRNGCTS